MKLRHTLLVFLSGLIIFSAAACKKHPGSRGKVDPSLQFRDEAGNIVRLGDFLYTGRPVILTPVYYKCPSVCNMQLNRLAESIQALGYSLEDDLVLVSVSFNSEENPRIAAEKKKAYMEKYPLKGGNSWHFLTGEFEKIKALTKSLGFEYYLDKDSAEFIHKPVTYFLDSEGHILHALPGSKQPASVVRLMLADSGSVGTPTDRLLWFFLEFDEENSEFTLDYWNSFKFVLTAFILMYVILKKLKRV